MSNPSLVVMAAGIGSRYGGLKQLDPIGPNGELIIDYSVYDAVKAGFDKVVFIIRKEIEDAFRRRIGCSIEKHIETLYVYQELHNVPPGFIIPENRIKPWGTAHAVICCKDAITSPFAVINADDFYGASSYKILREYLKDAKDKNGVYNYCVAGYILNNTLSKHGHVARGVCSVTEDGYLSEITERIKIQKFGEHVRYTEDGSNWVEIASDSIVSMNMWGFTPGLFLELDARFYEFLNKNLNQPKAEYLLPTVIGELIKEDKAGVKVLPTEEKWFGVTYREDILKVRGAISALIDRGIYPEKLWR